MSGRWSIARWTLLGVLFAAAPAEAVPAPAPAEAVPTPAPAEGAARPAELVWLDDLDRALELAAERDKPVLAYFAYRGCPWCRRMENETYPDPRVVEKIGGFIPVWIDRDRRSGMHEEFEIREYPTLIAFNGRRENVNRMTGFRDPRQLAEDLDETLRRFELMRADRTAEGFTPSEEPISDRGRIGTVPAPEEEVPTGICVQGDHLWIAQDKMLYEMDKRTGEVLRRQRLPTHVVDIGTDGELLFLAPFGWTSGQPILVFDPESGKFVRHLVNERFRQRPRGHRTHGIEFRDGLLDVLALGALYRVDPLTGDAVSSRSTGVKFRALSRRGDLLATGAPDGVVFLDPSTGDAVGRIPTRRPVRNVAVDGEELFLVGQPVYDYDRNNQRVRVWPKEMVVYRMSLAEADRGPRSTRVELDGSPTGK